MLNHAFEQTASIITTSYNDDGDQSFVSSLEIKCRFRWITDLERPANREEVRSDAMLWVKPSEEIAEGWIIKFEDDYFRVRRIIEARRLRGDTIFFKKILLDKYAEGIETAS
jgi:head-tail adaptor